MTFSGHIEDALAKLHGPTWSVGAAGEYKFAEIPLVEVVAFDTSSDICFCHPRFKWDFMAFEVAFLWHSNQLPGSTFFQVDNCFVECGQEWAIEDEKGLCG